MGQPQQNPEQSPIIVIPHQGGSSRGIAALLSLIIPGAGQMYRGKVMSGLLWLLFTFIGYAAMIIPGIVLHLMCIVAAGSGMREQVQYQATVNHEGKTIVKTVKTTKKSYSAIILLAIAAILFALAQIIPR